MGWDRYVPDNFQIFEVDIMAVVFTPLSMIKGDTKYIGLKLTGLAQALTSAVFSVKNNLDDQNPIFEKTLGDGIEQDPENLEFCQVRIDQEDTASLPDRELPSVTYFYRLSIEANGDKFSPLVGTLEVVKGA